MPGRESVLVDEEEHIGVSAHCAELPQAEPQQNALFHPCVYLPLAVNFLGRANFSLSQLVAEFEKGLARFRIVLDLTQGSEAFNGGLKGRHEKGSIEERISDCRFQIADV